MPEDEQDDIIQRLRAYASLQERELPIRLRRILRQHVQDNAPIGPLTVASHLAEEERKDSTAANALIERLRTFSEGQERELPIRLKQKLRQRLQEEAPKGPLSVFSELAEQEKIAAKETTREIPLPQEQTRIWIKAHAWLRSLLDGIAVLVQPRPMLVLGTSLAALVFVLTRFLDFGSNLQEAVFPSVPATKVASYVHDRPESTMYGFSAGSAEQKRRSQAIHLGIILTQLQVLAQAGEQQRAAEKIVEFQRVLGDLQISDDTLQTVTRLQEGLQKNQAEAWRILRQSLDSAATTANYRIPLEFGVWVENVRFISLLGQDENIRVPEGLLRNAGRFRAYFAEFGTDVPSGLHEKLTTIERLAQKATLDQQDYATLQTNAETLINLTTSSG